MLPCTLSLVLVSRLHCSTLSLALSSLSLYVLNHFHLRSYDCFGFFLRSHRQHCGTHLLSHHAHCHALTDCLIMSHLHKSINTHFYSVYSCRSILLCCNFVLSPRVFSSSTSLSVSAKRLHIFFSCRLHFLSFFLCYFTAFCVCRFRRILFTFVLAQCYCCCCFVFSLCSLSISVFLRPNHL